MKNDYVIIPIITEQLLENVDYFDINYIYEEPILLFNVDEYIMNIFLSYNKIWDNVKKQSKIDFPRQNIYVNNELLNDYGDLIKFLNENNKNKYLLDGKMIDISMIYLMLINQSSFYLPFLFTKNKYNGDNIHITSSEYPKKILFKINELKKFDVYINAYFNVFNLKTEKIIEILNVNLYIKMNEKTLDNVGFISWKKN